jgi:hypothetical protein
MVVKIMRIKDLIIETKQGFKDDQVRSLPSAKSYPQMDNSYELYRFGISMAGEPGQSSPTSAVGDVPVIVPYSKGDEEIIRTTEKLHGAKGKFLTSKGSKESKDTNKASPTANIKRNKYGV